MCREIVPSLTIERSSRYGQVAKTPVKRTEYTISPKPTVKPEPLSLRRNMSEAETRDRYIRVHIRG